ncbi:DUF6470 family protein [Neobacillus terrae]|uniref:DUF6470 family protein n=1 Tax=Neobacillus terrae TaxID=3034837 RepID=UPI001409791E|nr:DUF6470 family protein [Neobacillus terrae]NHM29966.1 hypothetical protein [Neobacillus terrae]
MRLPQIRLESTNAAIQITTQNAKVEIEQPPADLNIQQPQADMEINRTPSRLTIDQTKARADVDLKSTPQRISEAAQKGQQDLLEGIARRAQEGDELMRIENGGKPIADQAKKHSFLPEHEFRLGWIPSIGSVQINYDPGKLDIQWKVNRPVINVQNNKPILNYYPGKVETSLKDYPSIKTDFVNLKYVGPNYEQTI